MYRVQYYNELKNLAITIRKKYNLTTCRILPGKIKDICKREGIDEVRKWPNLKKLKAMYFQDASGCAIMVNNKLPRDPYAFTLAHELKHHLVDRDKIQTFCKKGPINDAIEIGAEIFAAELLFPEDMFLNMLQDLAGGSQVKPEHLVRLKKETDTTLSYEGISKRAVFHELISASSVQGIKWKKLEEEIYGEPVYKRVNRYRQMRKSF